MMKKYVICIAFFFNTLSLLAERERAKIIIHKDDNLHIAFRHTQHQNIIPQEKTEIAPFCKNITPEDASNETILLTRKKNTTSTILGGLAQICVHIGNLIANKNNKDQQQQAALGIVGTSLNVAAQLTEKTDKNTPIQQTKCESTLALEIASISTTLLDVITKTPLPQTLNLLNSLPTNKQRIDMIEQILTNEEDSIKLLYDFLVATQQHLYEHNENK